MAESGGGKTSLLSGRAVTIVAAVAVLLLALAAVLWPRGPESPVSRGLLVLDPAGHEGRATDTWPALAAFLAGPDEATPPVHVARTREEFRDGLGGRPAFVVCPDGVALALAPDAYAPLAAGRRAAPRNLRPRSVLVYRKAAGLVPAPWQARPAATVVGDSFSLAGTGGWRGDAAAARPRSGCSWGPDPYDHAAALHAARLGCFDYALVRQWDAEGFFAAGLLDPLEWAVEPLSGPVPDLVVLASSALSGGARLAAGEKLAGLGREQGGDSPAAQRLRRSLANLGLVGFNLLVEPDFDLVRRNFAPDWLPGSD